MSKASAETLARCLADIESGRATLEQCLESHREESHDLREMLELALAVRSLPLVRPSEEFRRQGRVALVEAITAVSEPPAASPARRFWRQMVEAWAPPRQLAWGRVGVPTLILAVVLVLTTATGGGVVWASRDTLPGDTFYEVKTSLEGWQLAFAGGDEGKAQVHLQLAAKRLDEVERAAQAGRADSVRLAAEALEHSLLQADGHLREAETAGKDVSELADLLADNLARQQAILAGAREQVAPEPGEALGKAGEKAGKGLEVAASAVARKPTRDEPTPTPTPAATSMAATPTATAPGRPLPPPAADKPGGPPARKGEGTGLAPRASALLEAAREGNPEEVRAQADELIATIDAELAQLETAGGIARVNRGRRLESALLEIRADVQGLSDHVPAEAQTALAKVLQKVEQGLARAQSVDGPPSAPQGGTASPTPAQPTATATPTPTAGGGFGSPPPGAPPPLPTEVPTEDEDEPPISPPGPANRP